MSDEQNKPEEKVEEQPQETTNVNGPTLGYPGNVSRVYYNNSPTRSYVTYSGPSQYVSHAPVSRVVYDQRGSYVTGGVETVEDRPVRVSYRRLDAPVEGVSRSYVTTGSNYYSSYPRTEEVVVDGNYSTRPVRVSYRRLDGSRTEEVVYDDQYYSRPARVSYRRYADPREVANRSYVTNTRSYIASPVDRVYSSNVKDEEVVVDNHDNDHHFAGNNKPQEVIVESKKKGKRHNVPAPTEKGKKNQGFCSQYCGCCSKTCGC